MSDFAVKGPELSVHSTQPTSTTRAFADTVGASRDELAARLLELVGLEEPGTVVFADQVHGSTVLGPEAKALQFGNRWEILPDCDGLWTDRPGRLLAIRTADCVPVVLAATNRPWVAVIHAGWRGTFDHILEKCIRTALKSGIRPGEIGIWIGPAISGEAYEVSPELAGQFRRRFADYGEFTRDRLLDLPELNRLQALRLGIRPELVSRNVHCTFGEGRLFPSYRRDGECRGQIYTMIAIRDL